MALEDLSPALLWKHFEKLCSIPRPSGHEKKAVDYVVALAQKWGMEYVCDEVNNVIVRKKASPGFENRRGVILQSHLDMVPQKNEGTVHDFLTDPIVPFVDGEWVRARGTTLGADNGIGAAAALAVLEDTSLAHGPLEALFTVDEESGMTGAMNLASGVLRGSALVNLDTEDEGEVYIGCAGGVDVLIDIPVSREPVQEGVAFALAVRGLKGGHSGLDINLGRGNAIRVLVRCLYKAANDFGLRIDSVRGGSVRNAIPREAFSEVVLPEGKASEFRQYVRDFETTVKTELQVADPAVEVTVDSVSVPQSVLSFGSQLKLLRALYSCPNGVIRMSDRVKGVVETSGNLAMIASEDEKVEVQCLLRSSVDSARDDLCCAVESAFAPAGAMVDFSGGYPGWDPDPQSSLLRTMKQVYRDLFGNEPQVKVVHAGLECGIIKAKYPDLELVSVGPTIRYPHSPDERVHIGSVGKFWSYLVGTLAEIQ
ncbi:MAG: aminoacyl-histidine dipeptidase [Fibrobacterota bacterium]